jgi:hypothetical protein
MDCDGVLQWRVMPRFGQSLIFIIASDLTPNGFCYLIVDAPRRV